MPFLDGGDVQSGRKNARRNVETLKAAAEQGEKILVPQPTCSYVLKNEYSLLAPGDDAKKVAGATMDIFEYQYLKVPASHALAGALQGGSNKARNNPSNGRYAAEARLFAQNRAQLIQDLRD